MVDILAIGAHPDDVELGCSGVILKQLELGSTVSILDLTKGELGTRGNADIRSEETKVASQILGIKDRTNLGFRDGFFAIDEVHIVELAKIIRLKKPKVILCNALDDRHPDHGKAAELVRKAIFYAGLSKIQTEYNGNIQEIWRANFLFHYIQFKYIKPDFIVDITPFFEKKMNAIKAYRSQFYDPNSKEPQTPISSQNFLDFMEARMVEFGREIGVKYAEGFSANRVIGVHNLMDIK